MNIDYHLQNVSHKHFDSPMLIHWGWSYICQFFCETSNFMTFLQKFSLYGSYDLLSWPNLWVHNLTPHAVTLSGDQDFKGFLVIAMNSAGQRVGSWTTGSDSRTTCAVSTHISCSTYAAWGSLALVCALHMVHSLIEYWILNWIEYSGVIVHAVLGLKYAQDSHTLT